MRCYVAYGQKLCNGYVILHIDENNKIQVTKEVVWIRDDSEKNSRRLATFSNAVKFKILPAEIKDKHKSGSRSKSDKSGEQSLKLEMYMIVVRLLEDLYNGEVHHVEFGLMSQTSSQPMHFQGLNSRHGVKIIEVSNAHSACRTIRSSSPASSRTSDNHLQVPLAQLPRGSRIAPALEVPNNLPSPCPSDSEVETEQIAVQKSTNVHGHTNTKSNSSTASSPSQFILSL